MVSSFVGFSEGSLYIPRTPLQLLCSARQALVDNEPELANVFIKQLPPGIANQIFSEVSRRDEMGGSRGSYCVLQDAFFGLKHCWLATKFKITVLNTVINEASLSASIGAPSVGILFEKFVRAVSRLKVQSSLRAPVPSREQFTAEVQRTTSLPLKLVGVISTYVAECFDAEEWFRYFLASQPRTVEWSGAVAEQDVAGLIRSPYNPSQRQWTVTVIQATGIVSDLVPIIHDYAIDCFGQEEWRQHFGVDVGPAPELLGDFLGFWNGPDPIDPMQLVCDTHLPPVLRPASFVDVYSGETFPYSLGIFAQLVKIPMNGRRQSRCYVDGDIPDAHRIVPVGPAVWVVRRKGVVCRNENFPTMVSFMQFLNTRIQVRYETMPSVINLMTVDFARYVATGERHLGDASGAEGRLTYSATDGVSGNVRGDLHHVVGNYTPPPGTSRNATLSLTGRYEGLGDGSNSGGVALQCLFGAPEPVHPSVSVEGEAP